VDHGVDYEDNAARFMLQNKIAGLPVVDGGKLAGIITESDIFRLVVKMWDEEDKS